MGLFAKQGYEKTSLQAIADRLDVTKAAVYYHFRTKEAILESIVADLNRFLDELIAWGRDQPPTDDTRREVLNRLAAIVSDDRMRELMRLSQNNSTAISDLNVGAEMAERIAGVTRLLAGGKSDVETQMRAQLAIGALLMSSLTLPHLDVSDQERATAALTIATELITGAG